MKFKISLRILRMVEMLMGITYGKSSNEGPISTQQYDFQSEISHCCSLYCVSMTFVSGCVAMMCPSKNVRLGGRSMEIKFPFYLDVFGLLTQVK